MLVEREFLLKHFQALGWAKYTGLDGANVAIDRFGESAPAGQLFEHFGFTSENIVNTCKDIL